MRARFRERLKSVFQIKPGDSAVTFDRTVAIVELMLLAVGVWFAYSALRTGQDQTDESLKTRKAELTAQLYENERWWYDRMAEDPHAFSLIANVPKGTEPSDYIRETILAASPGRGAEISILGTVNELHNLMYDFRNFRSLMDESSESEKRTDSSTESENGINLQPWDRLHALRKTTSVAEEIFYHIERIYEYAEAGIIDESTANSWLGLAEQVGPHPLILVAAEDARRNAYVSESFAKWFAQTMNAHANKPLVKDFYPLLFKTPDVWIADFAEGKRKVFYRATKQ